MERAVILTEGDTIHARHLNLSAHAALTAAQEAPDVWEQIDLSGSLEEATRRVISEVRRKSEQGLKDAGGDRGRTADVLRIGYKTLISKLKEYGLDG